MQKIPLVRIVVWYIIGILIGYNYSTIFLPTLKYILFFLIGSIIFLILTAHFRRPSYAFNTLLVPAILSFAICLTILSVKVPTNFEKDSIWYGIIYEKPLLKNNSILLPVKLTPNSVNNKPDFSGSKVLLYTQKDSALINQINPGDRIAFKTVLKSIENNNNPDEFNYSRYLKSQGIILRGYASIDDITFTKNDGVSLTKSIFKLKQNLSLIFKNNLTDNDALAITSALVLGQKEFLSEDLKQGYINAGAIHVLAVSGLHIGIIYMFLDVLLKFMGKSKKSKALKFVIIVLCIWFYALIAGLSPSVTRASLMFTLIGLAKISGRDVSYFNILALAALILLLYNPLMIFDIGFQLSFVAVGGIVYFQPLIYETVKANNKTINYILNLLSVTLAAQLVSTPLTLYYFHQFPIYFWLTNLLLIPLIFCALILSFALLATFFIPVLGKVITILLTLCLKLTNNWIAFIDKLPNAVIQDINFPLVSIIIYLIILVLLTLWINKKKPGYIIGIATSVLIGLSINSYNRIKPHPPQITIYNQPQITTIGLYADNSNQLIYLADSVRMENAINYYFKNHWLKKGKTLCEVTLINMRDNFSTDKLIIQAHTVYHDDNPILSCANNLRKGMQLSDLPGSPYLLIDNPDTSLVAIGTKYVIFSTLTKSHTKEKWQLFAKNQHIELIDITKTGAFDLDLN